MRRDATWGWLGLLALLLAGCAGPEPEPELPNWAGELAGIWTRERPGLPAYVFEVQDAGDNSLQGRLVQGGEEDLVGYRFVVRCRPGGQLEGEASITWSDRPDKPYRTRWTGRCEGRDRIEMQQQWIQTDDAGRVLDSGQDQVGYAVDRPQDERVPASIPLGAGVTVGMAVRSRLTRGQEAPPPEGVAAQVPGADDGSETWLAVVGEDAEAWHVERSASAPGALLALRVAKADGRVLSAGLGRAGNAPWPLPLAPASAEEPVSAGEPTTLTTALGELPALKRTSAAGSAWMGSEPPYQGVLLRWESDGAGFQLATVEQELRQLPGLEGISAQVLCYDNGQRLARANHPVLGALSPLGEGAPPGDGLLALTMRGVALEVLELRQDATPQLRWE